MKNRNRNTIIILIVFFVLTVASRVAWAQNGTKLWFAVPVRNFTEFVTIDRDRITGDTIFGGFAIDVFEEVVNTNFPRLDYGFKKFEKSDGTMNGSFDDMLQNVNNKNYFGAVGEITILYNRSLLVDFTMPYMDSSIAMLVVKNEQQTKPTGSFSVLKITCAIVIASFCLSIICAGSYIFIVLVRVRSAGGDGDKKSLKKEIGSQMHTRVMIIIFFQIIVILIGCYIVSEKSVTRSRNVSKNGASSLTQLIRSKSNVGYREGSFIPGVLIQKGFSETHLISLKTEDEMVNMLFNGTTRGGVDAIIADTPQLLLLRSKYCANFTIVPTPSLHSTGFGFAFQKDENHSFVNAFSNGILKIVDNGKLGRIQDRTIGSLDTCPEDSDDSIDSSILDPKHTWILIVGVILVAILFVISFYFILL